MKTTKLIPIFLIGMMTTVTGFSQTVDLAKAKQLEQRLNEYNNALKTYMEQISNSGDLKSIKKTASLLRGETESILADVKSVYPVNDDYVLDAALDNAIAADIATVAPNTAQLLRTRAAIKIIEGAEKEEQQRPGYFVVLKTIKKLSKSLSNAANLNKAMSLTGRIKGEYNKLPSLKQ